MASIDKIIKLTKAQYDVLASGGGLDGSSIYLIAGCDDIRLDLVYPVGSVYITTNPQSPSERIGGVWELLPSGMFLRSAVSGVSNNRERSGGSDEANMPSHTHAIDHTHPAHNHFGSLDTVTSDPGDHTHTWNRDCPEYGQARSDMGYDWGSDYYRFNNGGAGTAGAGAHSHSTDSKSTSVDDAEISNMAVYTGYSGSSNATNVPAYKNVYMWRRVG